MFFCFRFYFGFLDRHDPQSALSGKVILDEVTPLGQETPPYPAFTLNDRYRRTRLQQEQLDTVGLRWSSPHSLIMRVNQRPLCLACARVFLPFLLPS